MRVLVAVGGNAMTAPDGSARPEDQIAAVRRAAEPIADLVAAGHEVLITHGNGPQVGNLLVKNELAAAVVPPVPLDWCVAQTQATIGFILVNALERAFAARGLATPVATVVTRTLVADDDPGFADPAKPIGRYLPEAEARPMVEHGQIWQDRGARGWRRVVASPEPEQILDAPAIRALASAGFVVVASGGGGIPVVDEPDGSIRGVEAVIDKDLAAAVLARAIGADVLVIATDVDAAVIGYGTADAKPIGDTTPAELRGYGAEFEGGSMRPKVEAVCRFVEAGGERGVITSLEKIFDGAAGRAGTVVQTPKAEGRPNA
ncbi:MAG TPA: carbamate kinase [Jatrophihabitantaceae bacterium]|nr:carbamate kinase [Jatrophihabitantaceae bacterium]